MLIDGVIIALIGMGTVFIFLTLIVVLMEIIARIIQCFPDPYTDLYAQSPSRIIPDEIVVAIAAAKAFSQEAKKNEEKTN